MTNEVSNIRIGLTIAFAIAILAIIAELCYVLWRRRRFRRQNLSGESDINNNNTTSSNSNSVPSKELLYFFCWKSQLSRIEPADGGGARQVFHSGTTYHDDPQEPIDLLKLQEMYGPSRVLFTIKEEEKEEETEHHHYFSDDQKSSSIEKEKKKRVCLKNWFEDAKTETEGEEEEDESPVMVVVNIDEMMDLELLETPFSTPCASPPYYTPTPSPSRHGDQVSVVEEEEEEEEEEVQTTDRNLTHIVTIEADV